MSRKPSGYWTKERCLEITLTCASRADFRRRFKGAYDAAQSRGWMSEICEHLPLLQRPNGYWTKERCSHEAAKHICRNDFVNGSNTAYQVAHEKGWLDEICRHMEERRRPLNYWTKERCAEVASKCTSVGQFYTDYASAHTAACENGWLSEITSHLARNLQDAIYLIREEFPVGMDFMVKIGITSIGRRSARIDQVFNLFERPVIVVHRPIANARRFERALLRDYRRKPNLTTLRGQSGFSELRMMTTAEIVSAVDFLGGNS